MENQNEQPTLKILENGTKEWILNGQLHRFDGPAVELADGSKFWWQKGQLHRLDGPAMEYADGSKQWLQNDRLHRLDGPAIESANGTKQWWINGENLSESEFNQKIKKLPPKEPKENSLSFFDSLIFD